MSENFDRRRGRSREGLAGGFISRILESDKDNDGKISKDEAPEQLQYRFAFIDQNSDGFINEEELRQISEKLRARGERGREEPTGNFMSRILESDKDNDGKISRDETPERFQDRFDSIDQNDDGFIDAEELRQIRGQFEGRRRASGPRGRRRLERGNRN